MNNLPDSRSFGHEVPEVKLSTSKLNFVADRVGQSLSQTIIITNDIPGTILQGRLFVDCHISDPPYTFDTHGWISFTPRQFESNYIECLTASPIIVML